MVRFFVDCTYCITPEYYTKIHSSRYSKQYYTVFFCFFFSTEIITELATERMVCKSDHCFYYSPLVINHHNHHHHMQLLITTRTSIHYLYITKIKQKKNGFIREFLRVSAAIHTIHNILHIIPYSLESHTFF